MTDLNTDTTNNNTTTSTDTPQYKTAIVLLCKLPYIQTLHTINKPTDTTVTAKSRLSSTIGVEQCNLFVWCVLRDLLVEIYTIQQQYHNTQIDIIIYYTPSIHTHMLQYEIQRLQLNECRFILWPIDETIELYTQSATYNYTNNNNTDNTSNLTLYLQSALYRLHTQQYTHSVLIGSDCIDITADILYNGIDTVLHSDTAYIIPAMDGGYCLLALPITYNNTVLYSVFDNIQWSTGTTCEQQRQRLIDSGLHVIDGATLSDIDDITDLKLLCDRMRQTPELRQKFAYTAIFCAEFTVKPNG